MNNKKIELSAIATAAATIPEACKSTENAGENTGELYAATSQEMNGARRVFPWDAPDYLPDSYLMQSGEFGEIFNEKQWNNDMGWCLNGGPFQRSPLVNLDLSELKGTTVQLRIGKEFNSRNIPAHVMDYVFYIAE